MIGDYGNINERREGLLSEAKLQQVNKDELKLKEAVKEKEHFSDYDAS